MNAVDADQIVAVSSMGDEELSRFLKDRVISLTLEEVRSLPSKLGRDPTLTELHIFNIQWSEHSSYKSSKKWLKLLPTEGSQVILGPVEDSGIVRLGAHRGETYGIIISHESHNHPSQVVPYEGAATGIGGIVRDVLCMGGEVIASADPLRFGDPTGKNRDRSTYVASSVVEGIAGYGNPLGVPVIAGDVYFNGSFDENCLVNVVCMGLVKEKDIIHSYAPEGADGHDLIVVGKATDASGFGGAAFASLVLDEKEEDSNKGAVQVPDPFLKNILIRASRQVFRELREQHITAGFKDMGAGGIMCATSEMASDAGFGVDIDLDRIHVAMDGLTPHVIAAAETQERFCWIVPKSFSPRLLQIYNDEFQLPLVAKGAKASVVGTVTKERQYRLSHKGKVVCNPPIDEVTKGVSYERPFRERGRQAGKAVLDSRISLSEPADCRSVLLQLLGHPNICSREKIYKHYDTEVQGNAVITPGQADAGVIAPLRGSSFGIALSVDSVPRYNRIDPFQGAVLAVHEAMRNVACVGAVPTALTDCLNYGNPEIPEAFGDFVLGVKGIAEAARNLYYYPEEKKKSPVPIVSGNVSFYNMSAKGSSVDPSPIISCVGVMKDYAKAVTSSLKGTGSTLVLLGRVKDELGGSAYLELREQAEKTDGTERAGERLPQMEYGEERNKIYGLLEAIDQGTVAAAHDVSDGGLGVTLAEMAIQGGRGIDVDLAFTGLRPDRALFGETPCIVVEIRQGKEEAFAAIMEKRDVQVFNLGRTTKEGFIVRDEDRKVIEATVDEMEDAWKNGLGGIF